MDLTEIVKLRKAGKFEEALLRMKEIYRNHPENPEYNYQLAWCNDVLGNEREAIPLYEKAIDLGIENELENVYIGLASSYRAIGEFAKALEIFNKAEQLFPANSAIKVFKSITLYNCGSNDLAVSNLIKILLENTNNGEIKKYERALLYYSDHLDKTVN